MNDQPLLIKPRDAARLLAISERKLWQLTNSRAIASVRIGRAVRYSYAELRAWTEAIKTPQRRAER